MKGNCPDDFALRIGTVIVCLMPYLLAPSFAQEQKRTVDDNVAAAHLFTVKVVVTGTTTAETTPTIYGSGVIIRPDGYIATAAHVVKEDSYWHNSPSHGVDRTVKVRLPNDKGVLDTEVPADVLQTDFKTDVAILKIPGLGYKSGNCADLSSVRGTNITRLGFPGDKPSALVADDRTGGAEASTSPYNFRAAIQSGNGNSGGPALNPMGQVVGIAVKKYEDLEFVERSETEFVKISEAIALLPHDGLGCSRAPPPSPMPPVPLACDGASATACIPKVASTFKDCENCPEMVVVPSGAVTVGSPASESNRYSDEGPLVDVKVGKPFAIGKFPVTVDQYAEFVGDSGRPDGRSCYIPNPRPVSTEPQKPTQAGNPNATIYRNPYYGGATLYANRNYESSLYGYGSQTYNYQTPVTQPEKVAKPFVDTIGYSWRDPGFKQAGNHPATCLNWNDAKAYAAWLSKKTGKEYRLPTESEWEFAARGKTTVGKYPKYFFGDRDEDLCSYANLADQRLTGFYYKDNFLAACNDGSRYTSPVGQLKANPFGLFDIHGNVFQWTEDCYFSSHAGLPRDGSAKLADDCKFRMAKGGSWAIIPEGTRDAFRRHEPPNLWLSDFGVRVVRVLSSPQ